MAHSCRESAGVSGWPAVRQAGSPTWRGQRQGLRAGLHHSSRGQLPTLQFPSPSLGRAGLPHQSVSFLAPRQPLRATLALSGSLQGLCRHKTGPARIQQQPGSLWHLPEGAPHPLSGLPSGDWVALAGRLAALSLPAPRGARQAARGVPCFCPAPPHLSWHPKVWISPLICWETARQVQTWLLLQ